VLEGLEIISGSYSDSLRLFNKAFNLYNQALNTRDVGRKALFSEALKTLLRASLLLKGVSLPELDITYLASVALDKGLITIGDFAEINDLNLKLNGYGEFSSLEFTKVFGKVVRRLELIDPYLAQQMYLYRY